MQFQHRHHYRGDKWGEWEDIDPPRHELVSLLEDFTPGTRVTIKTSSGHKGQWRIKRDD